MATWVEFTPRWFPLLLQVERAAAAEFVLVVALCSSAFGNGSRAVDGNDIDVWDY